MIPLDVPTVVYFVVQVELLVVVLLLVVVVLLLVIVGLRLSSFLS